MFDDLFDLAKTRTLKQSVGFFLFYSAIALAISVLLNTAGVH